MKNLIKNPFLLVLIIVVLYSCTDESKFINPVHFGLENGAFAKLQTASPRTTMLLGDLLDNGYVWITYFFVSQGKRIKTQIICTGK